MLLEIHERLSLLEILHEDEERYEALKTLRRAREVLSFTPEEIQGLNFRQEPTKDGKQAFLWDTDKSGGFMRDIPIDEWTTQRIRARLIKMEDTGKLKDRYVTLFEKFVVDYR